MIACAAISARALVEAAAADGVATVALDLFGDADTCRHASAWHPIGNPVTLCIERSPLLAALDALASQGGVDGWVAGSGFDGEPDLLLAAAERLPLFGTTPAAMHRLRDPREFFERLDTLEIDHPEVGFEPPATPEHWLLKDARSCGGWGVRPWGGPSAANDSGPGRYWQRRLAGQPMSATFIGNGREAVLLGFNRQLVREIGEHPFVFGGIVGPVSVDESVRSAITRAVGALTAEFGVVGLASLDFLNDGGRARVLELNPRPPASLVLYPDLHGGGPFRAHMNACRHGVLPQAPPPANSVRGQAIVYADAPLWLHAAAAARIADWPGACDLPRAGTRFSPGEPICSVSACGHEAEAVIAELARQSATLRTSLETPS